MSGIPETTAHSLSRYFERRICCKGDTLNLEPEGDSYAKSEVEDKGYLTEQWRSDKENQQPVLRHHATGIRICPEPLDLVERVEFREPQEPTRVVFLYFSDAKAFTKAQKLSRVRPYDALQILVEEGVLRTADKDKLGNPTWYGHVSPLEPAELSRRGRPGKDDPWNGASVCMAFFVPVAFCRSRTGSEDVLELKAPPPPKLEIDYGHQLVTAVMKFDAEGVRRCLELKADPNWVDSGGCTALHRAVDFKKAHWPVLDQLFEVCDITKRNLKGDLALDLADRCGQVDVADRLRSLMAVHPKGKFMLTYEHPPER